jgi:hypothetical protein
MGCDIHMVLEKRVKVRDREAWVGVNAFPYLTVQVYERNDGAYKTATGSSSWMVDGRNYDLFAQLASVRGEGPRQPLGVPDDASDLALMMVDRWEGDGHSHSWMLMDEALPLFLHHGQLGQPGEAVLTAMRSGTEAAIEKCFDHFWTLDEHYDANGLFVSRDKLSDFRLIFWFDN